MAKLNELLKSIYGDSDLGDHPFFTGDYINFGYWSDVNINAKISETDRSHASQVLYIHLLDALQLNSADEVCEIGIGHGAGTLLALAKYGVKFANGIDLQPQQIDREHKLLKKNKCDFSRVLLAQGSAEKTGLLNLSVTKIFSVEAAHHFPSIELFVKECHRILKAGGKLGFTTLFPISSEALKKLPEEVPDLDLVLHPMIPIDQIEKIILQYGFKIEKLEKIGKNVFPGFQKWVDQTQQKESWGSIWLDAYRRNLIDYFLLVAGKPE